MDQLSVTLPAGRRTTFAFGKSVATLMALTLLLTSCASTPGRPAIDTLGWEAKPKPSLASLLKKQYTKKERDQWIEFNLIRIDEEYAFRESRLRSLRTKWNIGTSAAALLFNVASSLTNSAGVKANYVAANTLAVGSNQIISKEEFLEQTVNTLITAMQGRRAETRKRVRIGMTRPENEYTLADAYTDLQAYDSAGTLTQGMNFTTDATKREARNQIEQADAEVAQAIIYTEPLKQLAACITNSLYSDTIDRDALAEVLDSLEVPYEKGADVDAMVAALTVKRRDEPPEFQRKLHQEMLARDLMLPCRRYQ